MTPYHETSAGVLYCGDCLEVMVGFAPDTVGCVVTSPPYFVGKEYETGWTWEQYSDLLSSVYWQAYRVLEPGRYAVVNFGDLHNSGGRMYAADVPSVYPAAASQWEWGRETGFDLQATRIWRKQFARCKTAPVINFRPRNVFDFEHIWTWRKPGNDGREWCADRALSQRGVIGDNWAVDGCLGFHCAAFPVDLPAWAIKVHSPEPGGTVLDPFLGSGTTAVACVQTGRSYIGIELSEAYCEIAARRIEKALAQPRLPLDAPREKPRTETLAI